MNRPLKNKLRRLTIFLALFAGASLFFYLLLNGGAYWKELRYWIFLQSPFSSPDLKTGEILKLASAAKLSPSENFTLVIPKIEASAPMVYPADGSTKAILSALEDGVALYPGSEEPGAKGRTVVLGHSSRATWYRGGYATVFALLPELQTGDKFYVLSKNKKITYQVFFSGVMNPNNTNRLLATEPPDSEMTLITCYPIGSASNRKVVRAKLISTEKI